MKETHRERMVATAQINEAIALVILGRVRDGVRHLNVLVDSGRESVAEAFRDLAAGSEGVLEEFCAVGSLAYRARTLGQGDPEIARIAFEESMRPDALGIPSHPPGAVDRARHSTRENSDARQQPDWRLGGASAGEATVGERLNTRASLGSTEKVPNEVLRASQSFPDPAGRISVMPARPADAMARSPINRNVPTNVSSPRQCFGPFVDVGGDEMFARLLSKNGRGSATSSRCTGRPILFLTRQGLSRE